MKDRLSP
jgi:hypothetical protein